MRRRSTCSIANAASSFRIAICASLLLLDVDHFKAVNDTHGPAKGVEVLKAVVDCCEALIRPNDAFGRIGGEEFVIVLADTDLTSAMTAAERYRQAIAGLDIGGLKVTASFGVASVADCASVEAWLDLADKGLYAAKAGGRNRCEAAKGGETAS